jgi:uncharacterized protein (TIGR00290 family)
VKKQQKTKDLDLEERKKVLLFWGGGKESALSLFELKSPEFEILGLLSCFESGTQRLQHSDVQYRLISAQAKALDLPLFSVDLPRAATNSLYQEKIKEKMDEIRGSQRVDALAFGTVKLKDVKNFWIECCKLWQLAPVFPLWGWSDSLVQQAFFGLGHQAVVHGLDAKKLPPAFLGRSYDSSFVSDLPLGVDSCGENAEFQSFVVDGPFFSKPLRIELGEVYEKECFRFRELILKEELMT